MSPLEVRCAAEPHTKVTDQHDKMHITVRLSRRGVSAGAASMRPEDGHVLASAPGESAGQRRAEIRGRAPGFLKREHPGEVVNGEDDAADVAGG